MVTFFFGLGVYIIKINRLITDILFAGCHVCSKTTNLFWNDKDWNNIVQNLKSGTYRKAVKSLAERIDNTLLCRSIDHESLKKETWQKRVIQTLLIGNEEHIFVCYYIYIIKKNSGNTYMYVCMYVCYVCM